jgi:hypothetical protein
MAIPQIDSALLAILPPKAKLKAQRLIAAAIDAESSFLSLIGRQERIREDLGALQAEQRQAVERAQAIGGKEEIAAAAAAFDPALAELSDEIKRLHQERDKREHRKTDAQQPVAQIRYWLEQAASRNAPLAPAPHAAPQLRDGENPLQAVRRLRDEITQLERELTQLRRAALPSAELKMRAREYVRELALAGTPSLHTQDAQFRVDWPPGSQMAMGSLGPGSLAITCWLFGDAVIAKLDELIERTVTGTGLASAERGKRAHQLEGRLASLQRDEEALIERYENDFDIPRRPTADPLAVLSVRYGLSMSKAS